ncbi:MAG: MlaD family protein [Desulfobulbus sp.]|jgi:paraquat-inducible protein B|uniref:PqiB family protein n=1 Tax=Desulfobulbus sp. TaxID=895 RepID=UPI0028429736|nr:MlaD family protein [Desulfobulbus sp.]MDR2549940.1 MlaD family protein [Desulfobulbus sp.]
MSDGSQLERHAATAVMQKKRRVSLVWIVPLVALALGGWLALKAIREKGPTITITFATADGLEAGKTKIKFKDVEIGEVETINLSEDASKVVVTAKMIKGSEPYLTDQSKFWVVRPRISGGSVSGLGTVLSGAYIGIDGNRAGSPARDFMGSEVPPVVTVGQPGRHFVLKADELGSLDIGAPVYYRQIQVGQVVGYGFDPDGKSIDIKIFIEAPHHTQITENTRFWNASGVDISLNAQGLKVETQSMVSLLSGGIAFDLPKDSPPGKAATENATYYLYPDHAAIQEKKYSIRDYYVLLFDESVRGLSVGAPVELYGIKLGEVVDLKLEFDTVRKKFLVPVTVVMEPERLGIAQVSKAKEVFAGDPEAMAKMLVEQQGLRAQLQSANLLTGQMMINLVFVPDAPKATITTRDGLRVIPTVPGSFERMQEGLGRIVANLEKVKFDQIGGELAQTLKEAKNTLAELSVLTRKVNTETTPKLQATLVELQKTLVEVQQGVGKDSPLNYTATKTLEELSLTLRSLRELAHTLDNQPQSIIFGKEKQANE